MRVLINAASANMGGALTYIINILKEISIKKTSNAYFIVIVPPDKLDQLSKLSNKNIIKIIPYIYTGHSIVKRIYFDNIIIPRMIRKFNIDILFSSTGFGTIKSPCPQVLLIRNAAYFSNMFKQKYRDANRSFRIIRLRKWLSLLSIKFADVVLFPSKSIYEQVKRHISLPEKKFHILHYGFSHSSFLNMNARPPKITRDIDKWKDNGCQILLHVSAYAIHKNLETVIEALPGLIKSGIKFKFITTIAREKTGNKVEYDQMINRIYKLGLSNTFIPTGHLEYEQLQFLYSRADIFIFPSITESFGHPLVEAMNCELPIIASDIAVNRELCGKAAIYFKPLDIEQCKEKIFEVLTNKDKKDRILKYTLKRSKEYVWSSYVDSLINLFKEISDSINKKRVK